MKRHLPTRPRRTAVVAGSTLVLLAAGAGVTIAAFHQSAPPAPTRPARSASALPVAGAGSPTPVAVSSGGELAPIAPSDDPISFATSASRALFEWDTTAPVALAGYKGRMLVVADPTGVEAPGLVSDLTNYLPSPQVWDHLRGYSTRQWLDVNGAAIPARWTVAAARSAGVVAPGTSAVTITGVRHRTGSWDGRVVADQFNVAFTAFVGCTPTYPTCSLLRLTQLDKPLR